MDVLELSRAQFAGTAAFHILFPMMSIGLAFYLFIMEALWLYTKNESYYHQLRFWLKIFVLTFAVGVASGFPLSFQFGTNWANFSTAVGSFFGNILGFETTIAFTLEASFLGIMIFGWKRVPRLVHLAANGLVLFGASLSAFWIIVANSWMQIPTGTHMENGKVIVDNYAAALFNPDTLITYTHKWFACIETTLFLIAGISAWAILRTADVRVKDFFLHSLKYVIAIAIVVTPIQIFIGDISGQTVAKHQPEKLAAVELHWDTNKPGEGAPLYLLAWPSATEHKNVFEIPIPNGLSLLITHSMSGTVPGINSFPEADRPTVVESTMVFYSFRAMVGLGLFMVFLMLLGCWYWYKGRLSIEHISNYRRFLWLWVIAIPSGFIATEAGWMVREIGRQPWTVYHVMRTSESVSPNLNAGVVGSILGLIIVLYTVLLGVFIYFVRKTILKGPTFESPEPLDIPSSRV